VEKFTTITGVAAPLPEADLDTDIIFPARFLLLLDKAGIGKHVFHERRYPRAPGKPEFILNVPPFDHASILVAGANFGSGSSREQAVWALLDFGIRCVIAPTFGEIFYGNCFKNGLLPIMLSSADHTSVMRAAETAKPLSVSLERQAIVLPDGMVIRFDVDAYRRDALLSGLDEIGSILADDGADIEFFEARQRRESPWLHLGGRQDVFVDLSQTAEVEETKDG
jgi:3-isopropylmalate/(R)-2-methylmalate dehydratase small subunit